MTKKNGGGRVTLTNKQSRFVDEYVKDYNATQAAIRAGYSERTASTSGYRNTNNDEIVEAIEKKQNEVREQLQRQFSSDAVVARKIMFDIMKSDDAPDHVRLSAAKDFLDRAGYKPTEDMNIHSTGDMGIKIEWVDDD